MQKLMQKIVSYVHQVLLLLTTVTKKIQLKIEQYLDITIKTVVLHYLDFPYKIISYLNKWNLSTPFIIIFFKILLFFLLIFHISSSRQTSGYTVFLFFTSYHIVHPIISLWIIFYVLTFLRSTSMIILGIDFLLKYWVIP